MTIVRYTLLKDLKVETGMSSTALRVLAIMADVPLLRIKAGYLGVKDDDLPALLSAHQTYLRRADRLIVATRRPRRRQRFVHSRASSPADSPAAEPAV